MPCSIYARIVLAVASGRKLIKSGTAAASAELERSSKVYISFDTMSVSPPTERANSDVSSKIGNRISRKL